MSVIPFVKKLPEDTEGTEVEIYGCNDCGSTSFTLATAGYIFCSDCESTVPLMVTQFPTFVTGLLTEGSPSAKGTNEDA